MNYNYRDWVAIKKIDKPMSNMRTVNYLIKCYNIKKINDINKGRLDKADKYDLICQGLKNVKKDLEILDILKKHCDFSINDDEVNIFAKEEYDTDYQGEYTSVRIPNEEDRKKVEEWLDNE